MKTKSAATAPTNTREAPSTKFSSLFKFAASDFSRTAIVLENKAPTIPARTTTAQGGNDGKSFVHGSKKTSWACKRTVTTKARGIARALEDATTTGRARPR